MNSLYSQDHLLQKERLVEAVRYLHQRGWAPASSSNYSVRATDELVCVSRSGVDKQFFTSEDLIYVNHQGQPIFPPDALPSAETLLHTLVYSREPRAGCVLHTHSVANTVMSVRYAKRKKLVFEGFEIQKAVHGQSSHEDRLVVPVFANTQDIPALAAEVGEHWRRHPEMAAYLIVGHGLYTWGESIAEAKRQVEALEFLMECRLRLDLYKAAG